MYICVIKTLSLVCIYIYIYIYSRWCIYTYKCVRCVVRSIGAPSTVACFRPVCWSSCRVIIKRRHRVRPHSHHRHYTVVSVDITAATAFTAITSATSAAAAEPLYRHLCIRRHHRPPPQRHAADTVYPPPQHAPSRRNQRRNTHA